VDRSRPFLLLRARVKAEARPEFDRWFRDVHQKAVATIPGILETVSGSTPGGTRLAVYTFESAEVVQSALSSPQAAYARGTWERWQPVLEELQIEIWASLVPTPGTLRVN
jgi:hypothetical protein